MRPRSAARAVALQALYQFDLRGEEFAPYLAGFLMEWASDRETRSYARELIEGCRLVMDELDESIAAHAEHWDIRRMPAVDRAVLRIGTYELRYSPDVPPKVALDEAIRLAKKYGGEDSGRFVNGLLDKIMAQTGRSSKRGR